MEPPQQSQQPEQPQQPQLSQPQFQPPAQQPQQPQQPQSQQQPQPQQFQQPQQPQQPQQTPQNPQSQEPQQPQQAQAPGQAETPPSYAPLPAPPDALFRTEVEAVQAVKAFAQVHQYAVITKRTNKGREGKVEAIYMTCDQGQTYRSTAKERQREPSRRTGCPFSLRISHHKTDNLWHVKVRDPTHNHGPSQPGQHPSIRREEISQKTQYIKALLDINMPPSQILKQLRHVDPSTVIQIRDIYNLRHRLYQGKTPTPAVIISDFKQSKPRKRRATEGSDNQSSGEASLPGAVEPNVLGDDQGLASPVSGIPGTQDMHTPEQLLINTLF
ncbi:uncharacterized protein DSM5745_01905 [Aspergillus mulundensis]|uniref:FAR1 domain-containing protein n=1 Tax=Aspergillus mulundensis TaxID=1810919 RepID=A0A3D8SV12_9EURO|nr:hypothetical protein DSM5745_01905 [Aspergillus mulundensis]RDW90130.1 hypothetical protein DSM5745_01905 [Aspergillus mulundensis]